jgi:transcriptional regulator with XRE-family HTH domain
MARINPLPKTEVGICRRLKSFRLRTGLARVAFAKRIGVDSSALVRCEHCRVPVTLEMFIAVAKGYDINPNWLARGKGAWTTGKALNYSKIAGRNSPKDHFSSFYKTRFSKLFDSLDATASATIDELTKVFVSLSREINNNPESLPPRALTKAAQIARRLIRSVEKMRKVARNSRKRRSKRLRSPAR